MAERRCDWTRRWFMTRLWYEYRTHRREGLPPHRALATAVKFAAL